MREGAACGPALALATLIRSEILLTAVAALLAPDAALLPPAVAAANRMSGVRRPKARSGLVVQVSQSVMALRSSVGCRIP